MDRPRKVCLVGSSRFKAAHEQAMRAETLAGRIVLPLGLYGHQEGMNMEGPVKAMLDRLHLAKIDEADEVLVVNPRVPWCRHCRTFRMLSTGCPCGRAFEGVLRPYVGDSTRNEIAYAESTGKPVRYLNDPEPKE